MSQQPLNKLQRAFWKGLASDVFPEDLSMFSYSQQTLKSPNLLARFAHRTRLRRACELLRKRSGVSRVLDYGCGSGEFLALLQTIPDLTAIGYEPFMEERVAKQIRICSTLESVNIFAPFDVITVLETVEHLDDQELLAFLINVDALLAADGALLFSAPIEIGPALMLKTLNRARRQGGWPKIPAMQLLAGSVLAIPPQRALNIKTSHQGFDFRKTIRFLSQHFGPVKLAGYSPLPIGTWYGNSQVFFWLERSTQRELNNKS